MKVITHNVIVANEEDRRQLSNINISVCEHCERMHDIPEHVEYLGINHGLHDGDCEHPRHNDTDEDGWYLIQ